MFFTFRLFEGVNIMSNPKKKEFLQELGALARAARRNMEADDWDMRKVLHESGLNPGSHDPAFQRCVREASETCKPPKCNPYAVCRAAVDRR